MKKNSLIFLDMLDELSRDELVDLITFAAVPSIKRSNKATYLFELLKEIPAEQDSPRKVINWLKRKLYPNDDTGRYFQRVLKEAIGILQLYIGLRELKNDRTEHLLLLLHALPANSAGPGFEVMLRELGSLLKESPSRSYDYSFRAYRYEVMQEKMMAQRRDAKQEHNYFRTLNNLDRFYFIEKLRYAILLKLWSNVYREKLPDFITRQIDFLGSQFANVPEDDPVLDIYLLAYRLYYEKAESIKSRELLSKLNQHAALLSEMELNDLYNLASNFYINKINSRPLSTVELKAAYQENFELFRFQAEQGLLREGKYIPDGRFVNVIAAALAIGEKDNLDWAESFLDQYISQVEPEERQPALEKFSRGAICFYRKDFNKCMEWLSDISYSNRFYYCDIKSLRLRAQFETRDFSADYPEEIKNTKRMIRRDDSISGLHKKSYLNFFSLTNALFKCCETGRPDQKALGRLKVRVENANPLAQKKWLLEKIRELEEGS